MLLPMPLHVPTMTMLSHAMFGSVIQLMSVPNRWLIRP